VVAEVDFWFMREPLYHRGCQNPEAGRILKGSC